MNRPGQPPQRPPSLGPNPALAAGPFRGGPYQAYGLPPRGVMGAYPGMPTHRAVPQPSPGFVQQQQQRTQGFPFGALQQQQQQQQQQQPPPNQQQTTQQPTHPGQPPSAPPHLPTPGAGPDGGGGGLDPNDFPALGASPAVPHSTTTASQGSYASQAGTQPPAGNGVRDFTPDDFPALGADPPTTTNSAANAASNSTASSAAQHSQSLPPSAQSQIPSHVPPLPPPGLNGHERGPISQTPGVLNLGPRGIQGIQAEAEKQRNMKLAAQAAWSSPSAHSAQAQSQTQPLPTQSATSAYAPLTSSTPANATSAGNVQTQNGGPPGSAVVGASTGAGSAEVTAATATAVAPQTPAQQVLVSPADRWGLLGLLAMIKGADADATLLAIGTDLGTMGLDMQHNGNLYPSFITPWADASAAHAVEPDFHLPACYNVQPPPPGPNKVAAFSDETLFFMFYSSPRDALQEIAAQELFNRNWRYHKELRMWLTKENGTAPSQKVPGGEQGTYTVWDPDNWAKDRKEMTILYADLEEKTQPVFAQGPTLQMTGAGAGAGNGVVGTGVAVGVPVQPQAQQIAGRAVGF